MKKQKKISLMALVFVLGCTTMALAQYTGYPYYPGYPGAPGYPGDQGVPGIGTPAPSVPGTGSTGGTGGTGGTIGGGTGSSGSGGSVGTGNSILMGYAIVTPQVASQAQSMSVFETFANQSGCGNNFAGVMPSALYTMGALPLTANSAMGLDLGIAIVNPQNKVANVTLTLRDNTGAFNLSTGSTTIQVRAMQQVAVFTSQLFPQMLANNGNNGSVLGGTSFQGNLFFQSDVPVAVIGLRFQGLGFSTIPVVGLSQAYDVPVLGAGVGGLGAVILPQFAVGQGWASQIGVTNTGQNSLPFRIDLFDQNGQPLVTNMNGQTGSSFQNLSINGGGSYFTSTTTSNTPGSIGPFAVENGSNY
jgi:hypothetical protein